MISMKTIKLNKKATKMVAHTGLASFEKENTCSSFIAAGNHSYFGIETDVHVTSDGQFVIIHDDETGRVGDIDISVEKSTREALRKVRILDKENRFRSDLVIPDLVDYVRICKSYDKKCVLELKNEFVHTDIDNIINIIKAENYLENVIFISFCMSNLIHIKKHYPSQKVQFIFYEYTDSYGRNELVQDLIKYNMDLDIYFGLVDKDLVDLLHKNSLEINSWTVADESIAKQFIEWGVDYITTEIFE